MNGFLQHMMDTPALQLDSGVVGKSVRRMLCPGDTLS